MPTFQVISDIHLEARPFRWTQAPKADAVVIAGDIAPLLLYEKEAHELLKSIETRTIVILGNHCLYGQAHSLVNNHLLPSGQILDLFAAHQHVILLDDESVHFMGYRIVGSTLWSDFTLHGTPGASKNVATRHLTDFSAIAVDVRERGITRRRLLTPDDVAGMHARSAAYLADEIALGEPTVVVTHFLPSARSIDSKFLDPKWAPCNPYFATDCERLMQPNVKLFVHGHSHSQSSYSIGSTMVRSSPRGYRSSENPLFDPLFTIEVSP